MLAGPDFEDQGLVFHHPDGSWLRPNSVSDAFLRRVARHGLPRLTLHGLRHTWATLAFSRTEYTHGWSKNGSATPPSPSPSGSTATSPRASTTRRPTRLRGSCFRRHELEVFTSR